VLVKLTEQLVTPAVVVKEQVAALNEPPVKVSVKVTVPVGTFAGVVISATVAVTLAVQLVAPNAILQETFGTLVEVLSLGVTPTVIVAEGLVLPLCVPSPP
jgi:hypothetical protein